MRIFHVFLNTIIFNIYFCFISWKSVIKNVYFYSLCFYSTLALLRLRLNI